MASTLAHLHTVAAPSPQEQHQQALQSALKLTRHHAFSRRNTSPELPQDSNTDALDDSDVLESSMAADVAIACTPPLSVADSTDDVDDLFSPLTPFSPLQHDPNQYHHSSYHHSHHPFSHTSNTTASWLSLGAPPNPKSHPFDWTDRDILPLPDKSQVAKRLQTASSALASPIPLASPPALLNKAIRRPTVCFDLDMQDEKVIHTTTTTITPDKLDSPPLAQSAQVSSPSPQVLSVAGFTPSDAAAANAAAANAASAASAAASTEEQGKATLPKGVDALEHDLTSLSLESSNTGTTLSTTTPPKSTTHTTTDELLGHILVEQAPSDMMVALFDRPAELQALAARNTDFFKVLYTQIGSASLAAFKQTLFSSREEKSDLVWMQELARHLKAQPCVLEKFKVLVGWVGPDDGENSDNDDDDNDNGEDEYTLWGEDKYGYRDSSYEQIQIKWIRDYPEQLAAFPKEYPQFFINARERLEGKRLSFGGDRRDLFEIFYETLFLTREQLRCDNAWTRRINGCLDKHPELLLQLKELIAYEIGWDD